VIDLIFNPLPVNRIDRVTPFTYYAEDAPDDDNVLGRMEEGGSSQGGIGADAASIAESTNTLHEKKSRRFLSVWGGHATRSFSSHTIAKDDSVNGGGGIKEKDKGGHGKSKPRWSRTKTKLNE
jgi:hypothetical protein